MKAIFLASVLTILAGPVYAENVELERIVVTPTRIAQEGYKTGSNITVIDSKIIESSNAQSVADILKEKAGIHYYDNSSAKTATVDIRGFGDTAGRNVLLLVDGRKVNPADISGPDWLQLPLGIVKRIEVIRGAGSVLYGDNAVGGVVNIITKKGDGAISGKAGAMCASYDSYQEDVEVSGETGKFSHYLYLKHYDGDGYRSNSDVHTKDCNAKLGYEFSEDLSFDLTGGWHEDDYGLPGGLDDQGELTQYGRRGSPDESDFASTKDRYVNLSLDLRPWFDVTDSAHFNVDVFYRNRDSYSWLNYGGFPSAQKYMIDTKGATVKYTYDGSIGDDELNFVIGMDYYDIENIIKGSEWNSDDLTIFKEELGFYAYSEYEILRNLLINSGVRYQKAEYIFDQRQSTVRRETKEPTESVFMSGLKYEYDDDSSMHLSMQESFRFLATDEWYSTWSGLNTNLRQQTGIQYEVGIRHNFDDLALIAITPYWIDIKDEIYVNPYPSPGQNENYDKTRRKGVEMGIDLDLSRFIDLSYIDKTVLHANYTCQQAQFKGGDYGSNDIPMTPRHQAVAGLSAELHKNYNLSLTGRYIGERYAINDTRNETPKMKDCFTMDSKLSYNNDSLNVYACVNNIFGEKYFTYAAKSSSSNKKDYYPAPERNFEVGISYKF
ncbi:MAG: TonB-dependent receptor [Candidatus Omnitrophica bacterium]|nr:TonB-dependent receptor [Candidatus Omnitrophota bacterium]MBU4458128.1 TonB-dependent receptor [Candidatus Omnitrophota bacterium]